jgi:flagellar basal-body rod protein FlgB
MDLTGIFGLASRQAAWLSARQQTVAENIAHSDIPGYAVKDTEPFSALIGKSPRALARTDPRHISSHRPNEDIRLINTSASTGKGSGKVNVETELMKSTEVRSAYELNTAIVKAFHRMILTAAKA